ncbi:hypothetical protein ACNOYE_35535 [Nannocystaceae bacterium ST9]
MIASACLACAPEFEVDLALVDRPRVIAMIATPAEAGPGETVTLSALVATPEGTSVDATLDWSLCLARRPLAELGPIAPACVALQADAIAAIGEGTSVEATLPEDACRLFGPEPPAAMPGEPTGRPVDPDPSGGYFQPILGRFVGDDTDELDVLRVRLACGLSGATQAQAAEYTLRAQRNVAPAITEFATGDGSTTVGVGEPLDLRVRWTACPRESTCGDQLCSLDEASTCADDCMTTTGCAGAETHVFFDPLALEIAVRREAIGVTWYATAGEFDEARTGRASDDDEAGSDNVWTAPDEPGTVHLWAVLRDDRGGVGWASLDLAVE